SEAWKQFIYGTANDLNGSQSAMRGHNVGLLMYGQNDQAVNLVAFNGPGRLRTGGPVTYGTVTLPDDYLGINFTYFQADAFIRDPEHLGSRANPTVMPLGPYVGGNISYTYPDANNMFLAA